MPTKLGQNFLTDKSIVEKIISAANLQPDDFVIEVGPGEGILTEELIKHAGQVIAIELDKNLVAFLNTKFAGVKKLKIINEDVLKINLSELIQDCFNCHSERSEAEPKNLIRSLDKLGMTSPTYKVIANIPYYITAPIIRLFLEAENPPQEMLLMVQKEVAERIVAKPGQMSILAVSVQYYAEPKNLFPVSRNCFYPVPKVDSAIIKITKNSNLAAKNADENKKFFRTVRAGFSAKRKTLVNNLAGSFQLEKTVVEEKLKTIPLHGTVRAQELSIEDWKKLAEIIN